MPEKNIQFCGKRFYLKYFVKGNECLSLCCKSDEMQCLCVWFENCDLQGFKLKEKCSVSNYCLLNELAGNLNSKEHFDKGKHIRRNIDFVK